MSEYLATVRAKSEEEGRALVRLQTELLLPILRPVDRSWTEVQGVLQEEQFRELERRGYSTQVIETAADYNARKHAIVWRENPFKDGRLTESESWKPVWTVDTIESFMSATTEKYPDLTLLIRLPNLTAEARTCTALHLRAGPQQSRKAVLFTGSIHACEWGGSDSCVKFLTLLLRSYVSRSDIVLGKTKSYSYAQVRHIMETLDIIVFPDVNPDGKAWSQTKEANWRKNRNTKVGGGAIGVDCNRNFDFLWRDFSGPPADSYLISKDPKSNNYKGDHANSEPETRNVIYLLERFPFIELFMDIHSSTPTGDILYAWGIDDDQTNNKAMNFMNPAYSHPNVRGYDDNRYMEWIDVVDFGNATRLAGRMTSAINQVRGGAYRPAQSFRGIGGYYPTVATSDDYAYSRHILDPKRKKIYAYTLEYACKGGFVPDSADEMDKIAIDVTAAMLEMCVAAAGG